MRKQPQLEHLRRNAAPMINIIMYKQMQIVCIAAWQAEEKNFASFGQPTRLITCANHGNNVICS